MRGRYCYECSTDQHWPGECPKRNVSRTVDISASKPNGSQKVDVAKKTLRAKLLRDAVTKRDTVTPGLHCPTCTCQKPRVYKSNAERQKAYRDRGKQ